MSQTKTRDKFDPGGIMPACRSKAFSRSTSPASDERRA